MYKLIVNYPPLNYNKCKVKQYSSIVSQKGGNTNEKKYIQKTR